MAIAEAEPQTYAPIQTDLISASATETGSWWQRVPRAAKWAAALSFTAAVTISAVTEKPADWIGHLPSANKAFNEAARDQIKARVAQQYFQGTDGTKYTLELEAGDDYGPSSDKFTPHGKGILGFVGTVAFSLANLYPGAHFNEYERGPFGVAGNCLSSPDSPWNSELEFASEKDNNFTPLPTATVVDGKNGRFIVKPKPVAKKGDKVLPPLKFVGGNKPLGQLRGADGFTNATLLKNHCDPSTIDQKSAAQFNTFISRNTPRKVPKKVQKKG